jgi:hypothetical protein
MSTAGTKASLNRIIRQVRGDIYVETRSKVFHMAVHTTAGWSEGYATHGRARTRVRYWRILAVGARAGYDWLAFDQVAHDIADERGHWVDVARKLVSHLRGGADALEEADPGR